jgi:hypothetical protein
MIRLWIGHSPEQLATVAKRLVAKEFLPAEFARHQAGRIATPSSFQCVVICRFGLPSQLCDLCDTNLVARPSSRRRRHGSLSGA